MSNWQRLDTKIVYQNPYLTVHEDNVIRPDGKTTKYAWVETTPSVYVVPVNDNGDITLVKQLRYTTGQPSWELPGGSTESEEEEEAAKRELESEARMHADHWVRLSSEYYAWSGVATQRNVVFIAKGLHKAKAPDPATDDFINEVKAFSWHELKEMMKSGELSDGETITALTLAGLHLEKLR